MTALRPLHSGLVLLASLFLVACNSGMHAGLKTIKDEVFPRTVDVKRIDLQAQYRYLLVEQKGQEALLVWVGDESSHKGPVNVWVSADGVIIRTLHGQLMGVTEPQRQWALRSESLDLALIAATSNLRSIQITDTQPGFRMGVHREIEHRSFTPTDALVKWFNKGHLLRWVEELDAKSGERLAILGLDAAHATVAGQRCMSPQWCIRWQTWPPKGPSTPL